MNYQRANALNPDSSSGTPNPSIFTYLVGLSNGSGKISSFGLGATLSNRIGPRSAKRLSLVGKLTRGGLGKPLGLGVRWTLDFRLAGLCQTLRKLFSNFELKTQHSELPELPPSSLSQAILVAILCANRAFIPTPMHLVSTTRKIRASLAGAGGGATNQQIGALVVDPKVTIPGGHFGYSVIRLVNRKSRATHRRRRYKC
jgi:hypothetical protein